MLTGQGADVDLVGAMMGVAQDQVGSAAAAAACAAAHLGASPVAAGDTAAEALRHLWRWSSPMPLGMSSNAADANVTDATASPWVFRLDAVDDICAAISDV